MWTTVLAAVQQDDALHTLLLDSTTVRAHQHASGVLAPPIYGWPTLALAKYSLHTSELAVRALQELTSESATRGGPRLGELLRRTARPYLLAEQVVQAHPWGLPGSP